MLSEWFPNSKHCSIASLLSPSHTLGDSSQNYISHFVQDGVMHRYQCVVFNQRGTGDLLIKSPRITAVTNVHDIEVVLDVIQKRCPQSPIVGLGTSLGGYATPYTDIKPYDILHSMMFTKYLHMSGSCSKINACITFSVPWNIEAARPTFEESWLNRKIYMAKLLSGLKDIVQK